MQTIQLPDLKFKSAIATWSGTLAPCATLWGGYALEEPVLESTPLKEVNWATLFAYMHRRFGPPHMGGDVYKDLSAGWMLTTKDALVFVKVSPSLSGSGFSFTPYHQQSPKDSRSCDFELPASRIEEVKTAYRVTLLDLLRPVGVRDHLMNAMGELGDSELDQTLENFDEDSEDGSPYIVERHASSGYPIPAGLFGGDEWSTLCTIIRELGDGDMALGRKAVISLIQKQVFDEAATQTKEVKRLMFMANYGQRDVIAHGLNLSCAEIASFNADFKIISGTDADALNSTLVSELRLEDVETAAALLARLGMSGHGLKKRVINFKINQAIDESYSQLQLLAGNDFPEESIPANVFDENIDLEGYMRASFRLHGRQDLLEWLDSTLARAYGRQALSQIAFHLQSQAESMVDKKDENSMKP